MRIAFFGGSFDPPHRGHLAIARAARDRLRLDRVLVAPAGVQPLKRDGAPASYEDRLAMVALAVEHEPRLEASAADAPQPGGRPNYTLETLQELRRTLSADDKLFFLLGADSFLTLKQWHRCTELLLFCDFIVAGRPGFSLAQVTAALPAGISISGDCREAADYECFVVSDGAGRSSSLYLLPDLQFAVSATEIRVALAEQTAETDAERVLPAKVAAYIREHGLYRTPVDLPLAPAQRPR